MRLAHQAQTFAHDLGRAPVEIPHKFVQEFAVF
jgi:hypothetical protein